MQPPGGRQSHRPSWRRENRRVDRGQRIPNLIAEVAAAYSFLALWLAHPAVGVGDERICTSGPLAGGSCVEDVDCGVCSDGTGTCSYGFECGSRCVVGGKICTTDSDCGPLALCRPVECDSGTCEDLQFEGACCVDGVCETTTSSKCIGRSGVYLGNLSSCTANLCSGCGFMNPSFETGNLRGWKESTLFGPFFVVPDGVNLLFWPWASAATDGAFSLMHEFDGEGATLGPTKTLSQEVAILGPELSFDWRAAYDLQVACNGCSDRRIDVVLLKGDVELLRENILTAQGGTFVGDTGLRSTSIDLSGLMGQTVTVVLELVMPDDYSGPGQLQFDNFCIAPGGGACCLGNGDCINAVFDTECIEMLLGVPLPPGTSCTIDGVCPYGGCCLDGGSCQYPVDPGLCSSAAGLFLEEGMTCEAGAVCPVGACCNADGSCGALGVPLIEEHCDAAGGAFWIRGRDCGADLKVCERAFDSDDIQAFVACADGPFTDVQPGCRTWDLNSDKHVDLRDASFFVSLFEP